MDADPKIAATKDYVEYRDSYNALVASCPAAKGQMGFTISEKFNGYIRTPSGRFDLTYDPAEWDRVEDLAQKSYYQGGETDEQPSELGLDFMRRSRTKRGQDITVRIDGLPSNRLIEMQDSYWQNKYGTPGRLTNVGTRKVLIVEDDDGMGFTKIYFDGPVYGILVSTRGPRAARTLALPLMNKLIEGIRVK